MANTRAGAALAGAVAGMVMLSVLPVVAAEPTPVATVVLHVRDYQQVPANELSEAQRLAARVYRKIGITLVWTDGTKAQAPADGFVHVDVVLLDAAMADHHNPEPTALGQAAHGTKRAYIYYSRINLHAVQTQSDPARALALVLAHELGHVLLPAYSHTPDGLMRAHSDGRIVNVPPFAEHQAETIRMALSARH